jgi:NADPH:quinone reductase-like Zn-dependent oxidoreductase
MNQHAPYRGRHPDGDVGFGHSPVLAWRVHAFGSTDAMSLEHVERPTPKTGEVLVKVRAAGVGPWDLLIRSGRSVLPQPLPLTLGSDLAGEVAEVGPGETDLGVGDEVFGVANRRFTGAYAEYAVASTATLARKPATVTFVEAASVPVVAVTAWQALFDHAYVERGQTVLIHGAAGSVGGFAVQLARRAGVRIVATARRDDTTYLRQLGVDQVTDVQADKFEDEIGHADAVLDLIGGETQERLLGLLKPGGRLISIVSAPDQQAAARRGVLAAYFLVEVRSRDLARIAGLIDSRELNTHIGTILPLASAREAHLMLEGKLPKANGKIVLEI